MPEINEPESPTNRPNCPECGGDVCTLRDTKRRWTHRSRVLPRLAWVTLCLGLVGYWVSIGQWHSQVLANPVSTNASLSLASTSVYTNLYLYELEDESISISTSELQLAINGDQDALAQVVAKFGESAHWRPSQQGQPGLESVVFGLKETYGTFHSSVWYNFGGSLAHYSKNTMVQDLRDPNSIGRNPNQGNWRAGGWELFPRIRYSKLEHNDAMETSYSINLLNLFGVWSMCVVVAWVIRCVCLVCRISWVWRKRLGMVTLVLLMIVSGILGIIGKEVWEMPGSIHQPDVAQSVPYSIEVLNGAVQDPFKAKEICQELLDLVPADHEGNLLLSQFWIYQSPDQKWAQPTTSLVNAAIGRSFLLSSTRRTYQSIQEGEKIPKGHRFQFWRGFSERGVISFNWGPPEDRREFVFGVFLVVSIGVLSWLIWSVLHWGARVVFRRVQKRRVLLNQCIFCAYPLTAEAVNARYQAQVP